MFDFVTIKYESDLEFGGKIYRKYVFTEKEKPLKCIAFILQRETNDKPPTFEKGKYLCYFENKNTSHDGEHLKIWGIERVVEGKENKEKEIINPETIKGEIQSMYVTLDKFVKKLEEFTELLSKNL